MITKTHNRRQVQLDYTVRIRYPALQTRQEPTPAQIQTEDAHANKNDTPGKTAVQAIFFFLRIEVLRL